MLLLDLFSPIGPLEYRWGLLIIRSISLTVIISSILNNIRYWKAEYDFLSLFRCRQNWFCRLNSRHVSIGVVGQKQNSERIWIRWISTGFLLYDIHRDNELSMPGTLGKVMVLHVTTNVKLEIKQSKRKKKKKNFPQPSFEISSNIKPQLLT